MIELLDVAYKKLGYFCSKNFHPFASQFTKLHWRFPLNYLLVIFGSCTNGFCCAVFSAPMDRIRICVSGVFHRINSGSSLTTADIVDRIIENRFVHLSIFFYKKLRSKVV